MARECDDKLRTEQHIAARLQQQIAQHASPGRCAIRPVAVPITQLHRPADAVWPVEPKQRMAPTATSCASQGVVAFC